MDMTIGPQGISPQVQGLKGPKVDNKDIQGFSQQLLGFISNQQSKGNAEKAGDLPLLFNLAGIFQATDLEELGLSANQISELSKIEGMDLNQIADILGMDLEGMKSLFSDLQSLLMPAGERNPPETEDEPYELLLGFMQLLQYSFQQKGTGGQLQDSGRKGLEEIITLAKVMELVAKPRDLHVSEASKMTELKELVKLLQANVDASLTKLTKNWTGAMKDTVVQPSDSDQVIQSTDKKAIHAFQGSNLHFVLPKTESFTMNLSGSGRSVQYEQFVKEFQQILSKAQMTSQPNMSKLLIKLYPEQLGSLRIELLQQNGVMTAKILASTSTAKEMLDSQIQGLKHAFSAQNLQVDKIEVSQALTDMDRQSKGQSQQQSSHEQKNQRNAEQTEQREEDDQSFKDYLVNTEI
ncbi:flagellar hook-length control protein FliK [Bacillus sp. KH172YL63]|uniref:flagellar hook-length control protein FliK n=1 Tax=Bacillus sp. KH172YL63 TaxID=2709784 RepID=UPI0013E4D6E3|nr:flagellar hook-length control protein FliK [Bacillus sp. KH172YL63]BCB03357.1 hypothetical protein KH172YL63_14900 [Bacillus sp. KH172YL63]